MGYIREENTYVGTDLKYALNIAAEGFNMDDDEFEVLLTCGQKQLLLRKEDLVVDEGGQYYVCFSSVDLGPGVVIAKVTAHIPDDDFEDGFRDEVMKFTLVRLIL